MIMDSTESNRKQAQLEFPSLDAWRQLYDLASQVRKMEPWLWMEETDIFGVRDTDKDEEGRLLILALEQTLDVAPRVKEDRRLVARKPDTCTYLVRVPEWNGETRIWRDERREYPPPATTFQIKVPNLLMDAVRAMQPSGLTFELDVAPSPMAIGKRGERPQMPYMMMAVDSESSFILGVELLTVEGAIEDMWAQVPAKFLEMVRKNGLRPRKIAMCTPWVSMVMQGICKELGIAIKSDPKLRALTQARRDMERFSRR